MYQLISQVVLHWDALSENLYGFLIFPSRVACPWISHDKNILVSVCVCILLQICIILTELQNETQQPILKEVYRNCGELNS
jgi:hypothetical protein